MSTTALPFSNLVHIEPLPPSSHAHPVDSFAGAASLEAELRRVVSGEVRFDRGTRALYATDGSNYRHIPIGVVLPRTREDVIAAVAVCRRFGAPLLSRGAGTSLAGQGTNVAVILDFSRYLNRVLQTDAEAGWVRVEPGIVLDALQAEVKPLGWFFAPDPATHACCTLGGMLGNNSCGSHALFGGKTDDNTLELEVLLYDGTVMTVGETPEADLQAILKQGGRRGEIYTDLLLLREEYAALVRQRFPQIPRRVSGYNLNELLPENGFHLARALVGSEATCVVILSAKLQLKRNPACRTLVVVGYPDIYVASDQVPSILQHGPIAVEGFDNRLVEFMRQKSMLSNNIALLPEGQGWLFVEFGTDNTTESNALAHQFAQSLAGSHAHAVVVKEIADQRQLWEVREAALGATAFVPGQRPGWEGWEDHAVAPERLGAYLRAFRSLLTEFGYDTAFYGHFGQGCVHVRIDFDLRTEPGIRKFRAFLDRAANLTVSFGGSLSGEHGDGQARGVLLEKMFGPALVQAFERFKDIFDPDGMMNPGKLIRARQPHADLRYGADFAPAEPATHFAFAQDGDSFAHATERCVGVGKCRKEAGGTMCPSYMVTRDEKHSTRGRAHALFEMLQGEVLGKGTGEALWDDEAVKETLDLCLSCKACKSECPVNVDVATYKAEFMAHYYGHHRRHLNAYAFGHIDRWARIAHSVSPELLNLLLKLPGAAALTKAVLNVPPQRNIPEFAPKSFQKIFSCRMGNKSQGGREVLLWPDTFHNYFQPQVASSAQRVLEAAGFAVRVPRVHVCCGRPLYDFGFLNEAKRYLERTLQQIGPEIDAGIPVVMLEPSCASVFRDELTELLPGNEQAERLKRQTYLLSEFLQEHAPDWKPPLWPVQALVHGHCHHKALMKMTAENRVLERMGARATVLDAGCCGMAGPFGFERDKFDVSQALANRMLVPAVQAASAQTAIVADGFSCREAVSQNTPRHGLHLAELLDLASRPDRDSAAPEVLAREPLLRQRRRARVRIAAGVAAVGVVLASLLLLRRR